MVGYRQTDPRLAFLWEDSSQPEARWHGRGEGPAHYFSDTPQGAWAEFLRHEEITEQDDLLGVRRALWAVELPDAGHQRPRLNREVLRGDRSTYSACQKEARRLRAAGATGIRAPSAALSEGGAGGFCVDGGLKPGPRQNGFVYVLFGNRPDLIGRSVAGSGRPRPDVLELVHHFADGL